MASSPRWKVYDDFDNYQASLKEPEAAGALCAFYGKGSTIRLGHTKRDIAWTEGTTGNAFESYDEVAEACENFRLARVASFRD